MLPGATVSTSRKPFNFEKSLAELEALVARMEEGELSLEEQLKAFEQGVRLTQQCQQALNEAQQRVQVLDYEVLVATGRPPRASVTLGFRKRTARATSEGDGGYDAFMNALRKAARELGLEVARLEDYRVRIPPGGRTAALVETLISWSSDAHEEGSFSTLGVDSDQLAAAVIASEKMLSALAAQAKPRPRRRRKARAAR